MTGARHQLLVIVMLKVGIVNHSASAPTRDRFTVIVLVVNARRPQALASPCHLVSTEAYGLFLCAMPYLDLKYFAALAENVSSTECDCRISTFPK